MDKTRAGFSFRKSMRGFNKDDVVEYISEENKRFMQEKTALEEKLSEAEWHLADVTRKLEEQKEYFENLLKEKENELASAENKLSVAESKTTEAEIRASEAEGKITEANAENERLHALVKGCEEQLAMYAGRISEFETAFAAQQSDRQEYERVKAENDYIREKYKSLEVEYQALATKARSTEAAPSVYSSPRESHDDPFQRPRAIASERTNEYKKSTSSDAFSPKAGSPERGSSDKADTKEVSDKAISAILAINSDVKKYMTDCVGEFDSYSRDISDGFSKLADEISERCRILSDKIKAHKESVNDNIDSIYGGFESGK